MRHRYIVSYDIADDKRLRRVFKTMRGFGDHLQFSVFECELSDKERVIMEGAIKDVINHSEDQVLVINIGPADGRGAACIAALGKPYSPMERSAVVV